MPTYRLYRLDGAGKISSAEWVEANTDSHALRQVSEIVDGQPFELWERGRLVSRPDRGGNTA